MITACKAYITNCRTETVWIQPSGEVIKKLNDCIGINEEYQCCFHKTKEKLEKMPNEKSFEFSEMSIFGKFTKRLKNIISICDMFSVYATLSKIEGNVLI
jgi:dynein heavy chain